MSEPPAPRPRPVHPLDYAPPPAQRDADPQRMFFYLLPAGMFIGLIIGSLTIDAIFPGADQRNFAGHECALATVLPALIFGAKGIQEASRPRGLRAILWGGGLNLIVSVGLALAIWFVIRFNLLKPR